MRGRDAAATGISEGTTGTGGAAAAGERSGTSTKTVDFSWPDNLEVSGWGAPCMESAGGVGTIDFGFQIFCCNMGKELSTEHSLSAWPCLAQREQYRGKLSYVMDY